MLSLKIDRQIKIKAKIKINKIKNKYYISK